MSQGFHRFQRALSQPIPTWVRWLLVVAVIPLAIGGTQRLWSMRFFAPQYPQGLELGIYSYTITGGHDGSDLAEINVLNHYVGMRHLDAASFADLSFIPFAIGALALLAFRVAAIGDLRALLDLAVLTSYCGLFGLGRFAYTLWSYGHHLNPEAPIKVQGFMPPLLGAHEVANFTVSSFPSAGTFLIGLFGAAVALVALWMAAQAVLRPEAAPA